MSARAAKTAGVAALLWLSATAVAVAAPPPPADLHILEGDGWRATPSFTVGWRNMTAGAPIVAVHYQLLDPLGAVEQGPARIGWPAQQAAVRVGAIGAHTIEVWLEDAGGEQGPPAAAKLRYDPEPPSGVEPLPAGGWISRNELPYAVRLSHPNLPGPASGIRGYAVSIDRVGEGSPCADPVVCTDAETDLRGGAEEDALVVDELPEGTLHVHALAVSGAGVHSSEPGQVAIRVDRTDPLTRLLGVPTGWTNRAVALEARASDSGSGMAVRGDGAPFTAIGVDGGAPVTAAGDAVGTTLIAEGIHEVVFYARDAAGNVNDGARRNGVLDLPPYRATVRIDRSPPSVSFVGPSPGDPELIEARVADPLSGPDPGRGAIAVRRAGSGDRFQALPTSGAGPLLRARWRSDDFSPGRYEFRATGFDMAGNSASGSNRANGAPMTLPNPLKAGVRLAAGFGSRGSPARSVPYGAGVVFAGRLQASSDASLGGQPVRIVERFAAGAELPARTTVVVTDADGGFATRLAPGPSREVTAVFAGTRNVARAAAGPFRLGVRSRVSLRASASRARIGGKPILFIGRVAGRRGELPPGGVSVQLQFRAAGLPWSEFRTVRTGPAGRFRYRYRFSDDDSRGVRFLFRAVGEAQGDWPYEPGSSRPVAVRGV